jgi:hypothetical protein
MATKVAPIYHQEITRGPLAGCFILIPFRPSAFACDRAVEEQDQLLAAGKTIVSATRKPTDRLRLVA